MLGLVALVGWGLIGFGLVSTALREVALIGALILLLAPPATMGARSLRRADLEEDELGAEPGRERPRAASQVATGR